MNLKLDDAAILEKLFQFLKAMNQKRYLYISETKNSSLFNFTKDRK